MRLLVLALLGTLALSAGDQQQLGLALRAQADFDRVQLAPVPRLEDASACQQSQAALLPVAAREEVSTLHYHKGWCELVAAALTRSAARFDDAAAEFQKAIDAWPARFAHAKAGTVEPVASALPVLAAVARLNAGSGASISEATLDSAGGQIAAAETAEVCPASVMPAADCRRWLALGREWLGWMAIEREDLREAAADFAGFAGSGWPEWVAGRQAFTQARYSEAAADYSRAVENWDRLQREPAPSLDARLGPHPEMPAVLADLGGAQILAGDVRGAIATLDRAVKAGPDDARALYLRARAKEKAGEEESALADYGLASRTAFAEARNLASGEAHLYRGILLYRRNDYGRAEEEFASALNFDIPQSLRGDAVAWRHLAAVAGGACEASRVELGQSLGSVSPFFPKEEADRRMAACSAGGAGGQVGAAPLN